MAENPTSVPPEPPTLSNEREARLRFLQAEFATSTPSGKYFDRDEMLTLRDDLDALMGTVAALRAELADARAAAQAADHLDHLLISSRNDVEALLVACREAMAELELPDAMGADRAACGRRAWDRLYRAVDAAAPLFARAASGEDASHE